ncbi:MAG TPA: sulfurtransferase [Candidatus Sulfotelmatobacter sp.]|nr:sulfurtransferase [Candidatus Sulfotelmatobacter sp.]
MRPPLRIFVLLGVLAACAMPASRSSAAVDRARTASPHLLVDAAWLRVRLGDPGLRVVDLRAPREYAGGHVPGAVNLRVEEMGGTAVPALEERLGRAGIAPDHTVVLYDDQSGLPASRLFLTLEYLGHDRVHILDGGFPAWSAAGGALTRDLPRHPAAAYRARPRPDLIAGKADVLAGLGRPDRVLVDARSEAEFRGRDVRAARGGHIPGARHVEWTENLQRGAVPVWLSARELAALYRAAGVTPDKEVITYCQTHSRASHTFFTLRLLGYRRLKAYLGSWEEWGNDPALPVE